MALDERGRGNNINLCLIQQLNKLERNVQMKLKLLLQESFKVKLLFTLIKVRVSFCPQSFPFRQTAAKKCTKLRLFYKEYSMKD